MEKVEERLTVLKDYMTLDDMQNYFQASSGTIGKWEEKGLKVCLLSREKKYYKKDDIVEFLDSKKV